jgi:dihydrofolate reductase
MTATKHLPRPYSNLSLIVAYADNRVIGIENRLPWHLPEDLRHFKATTSGHTIIMGRKTYESIGRPLPNRRNLVLTRDLHWQAAGVETFHTLEAALLTCAEENEVFVIGGAELYRQALPCAARVYATEIALNVPGDATFPTLPADDFSEVQRSSHRSEATPSLAFDFVLYQRRNRV